jgi:hypothetical protein
MIRLLTAYTHELEDPRRAAREILEQLDIEKRQLQHSVALVFCHSAFIEQGVTQTVCDSLPCEALGCTSQYFALRETTDEILLTVSVLTSDDIEFAAGISDPLTNDTVDTHIQALYQQTSAALSAQPSLIFALQPTRFDLSGDAIASALDRASGGIPVFGASAIDMDIKLRNPQTIYRGAAYPDRAAALLLSGPVAPRFFSAVFPEQAVFAQDAVITGADGNNIISINHEPAVSFVKNLGIVQNSASNVLYVIPLVVDYRNGSPPEVIIINAIGPGGILICSRSVHAGGLLNIGSITADYVLETAGALTAAVSKAKAGSALFMFSCFSRVVAHGGNPMAEIRLIQNALADFPAPYLFSYSGGELCPRHTENGGLSNCFHQYALIACLL